MNDKAKVRLRYLDIARGICMICIVLGHLSNRNINRIVFTFHIPVFYLLTGYFSRKEDLKTHVKRKFRTLIIPYYISSFLVMFFYGLIGIIRGFDWNTIKTKLLELFKAMLYCAGDSWEKPFKIYGIGAIWFLWAIFLGEIIFQLLLRMKSGTRVVSVIFLLYFADFTVRKICFLPFSIQPACSAVIFIYIGYMVRQNIDLINNLSIEIKAFLITVAGLIWFSFILNFHSFWLVHSDFGRGIIDIIGSLAASFMVILISKVIDKKNFLIDGIAYLGKYSVLFLCAHIIELRTFPYGELIPLLIGSNQPDLKVLYVKIIIKFVWIILFVIITSKIKVVRNMFGLKNKD